jgi:hypothetical protein
MAANTAGRDHLAELGAEAMVAPGQDNLPQVLAEGAGYSTLSSIDVNKSSWKSTTIVANVISASEAEASGKASLKLVSDKAAQVKEECDGTLSAQNDTASDAASTAAPAISQPVGEYASKHLPIEMITATRLVEDSQHDDIASSVPLPSDEVETEDLQRDSTKQEQVPSAGSSQQSGVLEDADDLLRFLQTGSPTTIASSQDDTRDSKRKAPLGHLADLANGSQEEPCALESVSFADGEEGSGCIGELAQSKDQTSEEASRSSGSVTDSLATAVPIPMPQDIANESKAPSSLPNATNETPSPLSDQIAISSKMVPESSSIMAPSLGMQLTELPWGARPMLDPSGDLPSALSSTNLGNGAVDDNARPEQSSSEVGKEKDERISDQKQVGAPVSGTQSSSTLETSAGSGSFSSELTVSNWLDSEKLSVDLPESQLMAQPSTDAPLPQGKCMARDCQVTLLSIETDKVFKKSTMVRKVALFLCIESSLATLLQKQPSSASRSKLSARRHPSVSARTCGNLRRPQIQGVFHLVAGADENSAQCDVLTWNEVEHYISHVDIQSCETPLPDAAQKER